MKSGRNWLLSISIIFILSSQIATAFAGPYTDDLTKCLVESTTVSDRVKFVKWMFFAISMHPVAKNYASISEEQILETSKQTANLVMKLLTESCREKAQKAIKYEGQTALQKSFQTLGQIAAQDIFTNPEVAAVMSGLEKNLDGEKLRSTLGIK